MHDKISNTQNILQEAFRYKDLGLSVIAVNRQKKPLIIWAEYQERKASSDEIQHWFEVDFPNANVAIVTGQISDLVVLDLDKEDARETLKQHLPVGYDFNKVLTSITARGRHYLFKRPGYPVKNGTNILPGIDIRGDGGDVVAPPSIHETGTRYEWAVPLETGLPPLPEEICRLLQADKENRQEFRERFDTVRALNGVPEGERDTMIFKFACSVRCADVPEDYAVKLILESAQKCQPPFPKELALQKVAYVYGKYELKKRKK